MKLAVFTVASAILSNLGWSQSPDLFPAGATRVDFETDGLFSGDIDILSSRLALEQTRGSWRFRGRVSRIGHRIEYTPTFITSPTNRREEAWTYDVLIERTLSPKFALIGTLGYGDGYLDHRSIWISEFYDQVHGLNPAYREADPGFFPDHSVSSGTTIRVVVLSL